jgi:lysyl-tRNA synthetase class II
MRKIIKIVILLGIIGIIGAFIAYKYAMKPNDDLANATAKYKFSFAEIIEKTTNDTASLHKLKDEVIAINGRISKIEKDSNSMTIQMSDIHSQSSITCQIDQRHLNDFIQAKDGDEITIKGKIAAFTIDTELGLGNTIEMSFCTKQ